MIRGAALCVVLAACGRLGFETRATSDAAPDATPPAPPRIVIGDDHACVSRDGMLVCWGQNDDGQLATGDNTNREAPFATGFAAIDYGLGQNHTCALDPTGALWCWGTNVDGELGCCDVDDPVLSFTPLPANDGRAYTRIAVDDFHACAIAADDGGLYCWGINDAGELGVGDKLPRPRPTRVLPAGLDRYTAVAAGVSHTCATQPDDSLWCWGAGTSGELGDGMSKSALQPVRVAGPGIGAFDLGDSFTCANLGAELACWGANERLQLGVTDPADHPTPTPILAAPPVLGIGNEHSCAILAAGDIACWGANPAGGLGDGTIGANRVIGPTIPGPWTAVASGDEFSCAIDAADHVWCWGRNASGQLGTGTASAPIASPARVSGL